MFQYLYTGTHHILIGFANYRLGFTILPNHTYKGSFCSAPIIVSIWVLFVGLNSFCSATSLAMLKKKTGYLYLWLFPCVLPAYKVVHRLKGICFQCIVSTRFASVRLIGNLAIWSTRDYSRDTDHLIFSNPLIDGGQYDLPLLTVQPLEHGWHGLIFENNQCLVMSSFGLLGHKWELEIYYSDNILNINNSSNSSSNLKGEL